MKKVMIVEDEILVRVGLKSFLNWEEHGYIICGEAAEGREALEKAELLHPDIILTDLVMAGMDGFELIRECKIKHPEIRFIVLSSYNDFDNVREAMKLGADDYIFKLSSSPEKLLKTLDEVSEKIGAQAKSEKRKNNHQMDAFVARNVSALKRNFIHDVISGNISLENDYNYIHEFSKILGLTVDFEKPYYIMYLSIDDYEHIQTIQGESGILKVSVENIVKKVLEDEVGSEIFNYDKGDMIIVIQKSDSDTKQKKTDLQRIFDQISLYVKRYAGAGISGYAGQECSGIESFREIAGNMQRRLYKRLSSENGRLYFYMDNVREEIAYIEKYIHSNLDKELTVASVAKVANMSESYFSHVFKKEMGQSFTNYVNSVRINQAKEFLLKSDLKINEIAAEVGLENANYFSTLFKKYTGKSPNQFRGT